MKVLHVIPSVSLVHGGPSSAIRLMEVALRAARIRSIVATTDDEGPGQRTGRAKGVTIADTGAPRLFFRKWSEFYKIAPAFGCWAFANVQRFDIVHIHALFSFTSIAAAFAARWRGIPYVIRPLGTLSRYGLGQRRPWLKRLSLGLFEKRILRDAAAVHFTSQAEAEEARDMGVVLREVVIPLGVNPPGTADPALLTTRFPELQGTPYLLYLSRLDPKKNVEGLLRAFAICKPGWQGHVKLVIAGSGTPSYVCALKEMSDTLGLQEAVVWAGHLEGLLKESALAGAEAFVLPSYSENFGIAAAEALMAGLPCVLGNGVAIAMDVASAGAGLVVNTDPQSIAVALGAMMSDDIARAAMAQRALVLAQARFSAQAMGSNLVALYSRITSEQACPGDRRRGLHR